MFAVLVKRQLLLLRLVLSSFQFGRCKKSLQNFMKKALIAMTGLLLLSGFVMAQAIDGTAAFQKTTMSQPVVMIHLPYSPSITERAFHDYLSKASKKDQKEAANYQLSTSTVLVKNNVSNADMHFFIGRGDSQNKNESVIYLKLNSFTRYESTMDSNVVNFDMQEAKDYLNNLAIAIQPYAAELQKKLQQKDLANSQKAYNVLTDKGNKLQIKRKAIENRISDDTKGKNIDGLTKEKNRNDQKIKENLGALMNLNADINKQMAALALLR